MNHPDEWGGDPVTAFVSDQIAARPDRPKIVLAVLVQKREKDPAITGAMDRIGAGFLRFIPFECFGTPWSVYLAGFDPDDGLALWPFLADLTAFEFSEAAFYTEGKPRVRLAPVRPPVQPGDRL